MIVARSLRRPLIALLVAFHAAVTLCGPCLHAIPGAGHGTGQASSAPGEHADGDPSRHDLAGHCPICHFLAQGQLPLSSDTTLATRLFVTFVTNPPAPPGVSSPDLPSCPRAPPSFPRDLS
jgi:hypothetical protein